MLAGGGTLGGDAIPGDPGALASVASQFHRIAGEVDTIQSRVSANGLDGAWSGQAAEAFRASLHELPGELTKLSRSFSAAGDGVNTFASTLSELQGHANWYASQIDEAQIQLQQAQANQRNADHALANARHAHSAAADPVSQHNAQRAIDSASRALAGANASHQEHTDRISSLRSAAHQNHQNYEDAATRCANALDAASHLGIRNSFGSYVLHHLDGLVPLLALNPMLAPLVAVYELDTHWKESRHLLSMASDALSIAAVAIAPFPGLDFLTPVLYGASIVASGLVLQGDVVAAARHEKSGKDQLAGDLVDLGLTAIPGGKAARLGVKGALKFTPRALPPLQRSARKEVKVVSKWLHEGKPFRPAEPVKAVAEDTVKKFDSTNSNNAFNNKPVLTVPAPYGERSFEIPLGPKLQPAGAR